MNRKKVILGMIVSCFILVIGLGLNVNTKTAYALTQKEVKTKITKLNKEIKNLEAKKKKALSVEKKQKKGTTAIFGTLISNNPYIVRETSLVGNVYSYYWITNSKYMTTALSISTGYIKLTGKYKKYNGYTCAVGKSVKVSSQSTAIQAKIDKKKKTLKKYNCMLSDCVVFFDEWGDSINGKSYVMTEGITEGVMWTWKYYTVYNSKKYNSITWKSSNTNIATINSKGVVTAKNEGTVTISATCALSKKTTKCKVKVVKKNSNDSNNDYDSSYYINIVANDSLDGYEGITYKEAFDAFFSNPTWIYFKSDQGNDVVEFTGGLTVDGNEVTACLQFLIKNGDFEFSWLDYDEEEQSQSEMDDLLETVFSFYEEEISI